MRLHWRVGVKITLSGHGRVRLCDSAQNAIRRHQRSRQRAANTVLSDAGVLLTWSHGPKAVAA